MRALLPALLIFTSPLLTSCATGPDAYDVMIAQGMAEKGMIAELGAELDRDPRLVKMSWSDGDGSTLLHHAARAGQLDVMELLITRGADLNAKSHTGWTPLRDAIVGHQAAALRLLLQRGADPRIEDDGGLSAIHHVWTVKEPALTAVLAEFGITATPPSL